MKREIREAKMISEVIKTTIYVGEREKTLEIECSGDWITFRLDGKILFSGDWDTNFYKVFNRALEIWKLTEE